MPSINEPNSCCDCRLDLYSHILGPTTDSTILNGIEAILNLFSRFLCRREEKPIERSQSVQSFHIEPAKPILIDKCVQVEIDPPPKFTETCVAVCCACPSQSDKCCQCCSSTTINVEDTECNNLLKFGQSGDFQTDCQCPIDILYAIARITDYRNFTTYEILKPTRSRPRKIPEIIDGVFVLRKT